MKFVMTSLLICATLFGVACQSNHTTADVPLTPPKAEAPLPPTTRWEANDVFAGMAPYIPRELWPGIGPLAGGEKAVKTGGRLESIFQLQKIEEDEWVIAFMQHLAQEGKFIADPFQVEQFAAATGWKIEPGTISSSRTLRYFCQSSDPCIPPVVYEYHNGEWVEKKGTDYISAGSFILLCSPKPGAKAFFPEPKPAEPSGVVVYYSNPRFVRSTLQLINNRGETGEAVKATVEKPGGGVVHVGLPSPGNLRRGAKLAVTERDGRETTFTFPALTYNESDTPQLYLKITGCVPGNIPRITNNSTGHSTWPDGYKPPAKLPSGCED